MKPHFLCLLAFIAIASARPPEVTSQSPPGVYRIRVGDIKITALSDGTVPINLHDLLKGITPEQTDELLANNYLTNPLEASIACPYRSQRRSDR
jgi:hypothetical protein